jgi:hypothetical protein
LTKDGRKTSKLFFIFWSPPTANPQHKMAYSHAKSNFRGKIEGVFDINAGTTKDIELGMGLTDGNGDDDDSNSDFE